MHFRALLYLTTALAAWTNVSGWSFSKGSDPPIQTEPLPGIELPTAEHYWWNTITGKHRTAATTSLCKLTQQVFVKTGTVVSQAKHSGKTPIHTLQLVCAYKDSHCLGQSLHFIRVRHDRKALRVTLQTVCTLQTDEGHRYYINPESGQTTWDKPPQLAWLAAVSDEHERDYYYNTVTKVGTTCLQHISKQMSACTDSRSGVGVCVGEA